MNRRGDAIDQMLTLLFVVFIVIFILLFFSVSFIRSEHTQQRHITESESRFLAQSLFDQYLEYPITHDDLEMSIKDLISNHYLNHRLAPSSFTQGTRQFFQSTFLVEKGYAWQVFSGNWVPNADWYLRPPTYSGVDCLGYTSNQETVIVPLTFDGTYKTKSLSLRYCKNV